MTDRQPTKPNRYAVYDDNHNFIRYEYHERADEPTEAGDALNKANLLPDAVATALGLTGNPQVKDALAKIKTLIDSNTTLANAKAQVTTGSYTGTGATSKTIGCSGTPKLAIIFCTKQNILIGTSDMSALFPIINSDLINSYMVPVTWGADSITIQNYSTSIRINATESRYNPYYYAIFSW